MEKLCGNCKYLGKEVTGYDEDFNDVAKGYFACDLIKHDKQWKYEPKAGAVVVDGSGYSAALCVEADFGCNRWEEKPEEMKEQV